MGKKLYVGNLGYEVAQQDLQELLARAVSFDGHDFKGRALEVNEAMGRSGVAAAAGTRGNVATRGGLRMPLSARTPHVKS